VLQNSFRGIGFEPLDISTQVLGPGDQVKMIFQDDVAEDLKIAVLLEKPPGVQDDIHGFRPGEYRQPVVYRRCDKVRAPVMLYAVTAAGHGLISCVRKLELPETGSQAGAWEPAVSLWSLGTSDAPLELGNQQIHLSFLLVSI